ncbi:MAG TPA: hypothetical protein VGQ83_18085 [Polyangia bacterium]|jgi:hypothetical protein
MRKHLLAALVIAAVLAWAPPASAQVPAYVLTNSASQTLRFQTLDYARNTWKDQQLGPNATIKFEIRSGHTVGRLRISTEGRGQVEYEVKAGRAYMLVWDAGKGVWDVRFTPYYQLTNESNDTLKFQTLDYARNTWKDQVIYPNQTVTFELRSGSHAGRLRIATTGRGTVDYEVNAGWSYKLKWSNRKGVWDMRTVSKIY